MEALVEPGDQTAMLTNYRVLRQLKKRLRLQNYREDLQWLE
jgi:hypothetical protein